MQFAPFSGEMLKSLLNFTEQEKLWKTYAQLW